jgi:hypothetical protein
VTFHRPMYFVRERAREQRRDPPDTRAHALARAHTHTHTHTHIHTYAHSQRCFFRERRFLGAARNFGCSTTQFTHDLLPPPHFPQVSKDEKTGGTIDPTFQVIEDLLYKYKTDLIFVGHVHNTFVSCPVYKGKCVEPATPGAYAAPVHVCVGNAGQGATPIAATAPEWVLFQAAVYGYSTLNVHNATDLDLTLYGDVDGGEIYKVALSQTFPRT